MCEDQKCFQILEETNHCVLYPSQSPDVTKRIIQIPGHKKLHTIHFQTTFSTQYGFPSWPLPKKIKYGPQIHCLKF